MSNTPRTTGRLAIAAGLLVTATLAIAAPADAASMGHRTGMTTGPMAGPSIQLQPGRTHGHDGPKYAPPYANDRVPDTSATSITTTRTGCPAARSRRPPA